MKLSNYHGLLRRSSGNLLAMTALVLSIPLASASDPYGLTAAQPIGAYLNGALPTTTPGQGGTPQPPALLSEVGAFQDLANLTPVAGLIPYDLNAPLWTDGALKQRWLAVPNDGTLDSPAEQVVFSETGQWVFPVGSVLIKQFNLQIDDADPSAIRRVETRFIVHGSDGVYYGVTYRWRPDNSDADLLPDGDQEVITIATAGGGTRQQTWGYPSRADCMNCHNTNAGAVLGARAHQLNRDLEYPSTGVTDNQLRALNHIGLFSNPFSEGAIAGFPKSSNIANTSASLEMRVRSYLDSNCAHCHRPGGTNAYFDARFETPLAQQNLINGPLLYTNGIAGAHVITPQSVPQSMAHVRMVSLGQEQMPPVGKNVVDSAAIAVLEAWINSLDPAGGGGNAAPVASDDSAATAYETAVSISVLANDSDADGDSLSIESVGQGASGSVLINGDNTLTYTPDAGFSGNDYFGYTARDPSGAISNTATVTVSVAAAGADTAIGFTNNTSLLQGGSVRSGVAMAIADMNGDGRDDIVRFHAAKNLMIEFQDPGGGTFGHYAHGTVSSRAQWGVCVGDVENDGINDIVSGGYYDGLKKYAGRANGTWEQFTFSGPSLFLQTANLADIDGNGWLDLFACHDDAESHTYRNNGEGRLPYDPTLLDTSTTPSSDNSGNYGSVWTDYDGDGDIDMYLSKCRGGVSSPTDPRRINMLFQNDGNGNYTEVAAAAGLADGAQSWATDFADIDNDGDLDCFIGNHYATSRLMRNNGDGTFTDITASSGIADFSWKVIQVVFRDFNNDTWNDLLLVGAQHILYLNDGTTGQTFTAVANPFSSDWIESCAVGDLNHDGFVDVYAGYANLYNTPSTKADRMFFNDGNANNWLSLQLEGTNSNRNAIGARVELTGPWGVMVREVRAGESYGIQHSMTCQFGLGEHAAASQLVVRWPSGATDTISNPPVNSFLFLREGSSTPPTIDQPGAQSNWADDVVSLQISASDPTGDPLTYSAANLPAGLSIDPASGLISGTLNNASVGSYTVQVSASDAFSTAATTFVWEVTSVLKRYDGWLANTPGAGTSPSHNNDGDLYNDLLEFALGANPADGNTAGSGLHLDTSTGSEIDVLYVRPAAIQGVTYTLEASGDLVGWTDIGAPTVTGGSGDTETVRYASADSNSPLNAERGFVRLRVDLDSPAATARTIPIGWRRTPLALGFQTHGSSLPKKPVFVGRISSVAGGALEFAFGSPSAAMLAGRAHYIEVAGGPKEGQRADVDPTTSSGAVIGLDLNSPRSTLGPVSGDLVGVPILVREHQTLGEVFPLDNFQGTADPALSDQVQIFNGVGYDSYFALEAGPFNQWTGVSDPTLADAADAVIAPGQGVFVRTRGAATEVLNTGQVRFFDFAQPLSDGFNLIAEPFPIASSPATRGMLLGDGFYGSRLPAQSDQIQVWLPNADPAASGYKTYFLLDAGAGSGLRYWIDSADATLVDQDDTLMFLPGRGTFVKVHPAGGHPDYVVPCPWTP